MRSVISRKGQVNTLAPAMLALVFAAIILVFGLIISQELRDTDIVKEAVNPTVNETGGYLNATGYTLAQSTAPGYANPVISSIENATDGTTVATGNYTLTGNVLTNATEVVHWDVNVIYSFTRGGEAYDSTNSTIVGLGTFADFWEIIILAIVITIVIGLLLLTFGGQGRR